MTTRGSLLLMPNTLDLGAEACDLRDVLPDGVLRRAAALSYWAAEDARSTRAFLKRVAIIHPLAQTLQATTITELPRARKGTTDAPPASAWRQLLQPALAGHDVGLISEAGLPAVADPGALLVAAAHDLGIPVCAMTGPSSIVLALASSGLNGQSFAFVGYVPQEPGARDARLRELEALSRRLRQTQLMIETPYRNEALLKALITELAPSTQLSVSWGLTLTAGGTRSNSVAEWRQRPGDIPERCPAVFALLAR